ncbi:MAG: RNA methyltransferase [Bacteroidetes bacterium]|nr:RNA methyltransferase [Bacteroidota bacterium]
MLSKNQIKFISSLKQKKFREEHHLFIAEGNKVVLELLRSEIKIKQVFATVDFLNKTKINGSIDFLEVKPNEMERISALTTPSDVFAVCEIPTYKLNTDTLKGKLTLVLDDIKDPGNLGTIIRIADWFGISNILCSVNTADAFNPKVVQATMGSISRVKVHYMDLIELFKVESLKFKVFGALLEGENIYTKQLPSEGLIVIGNESKGIAESLLSYITDKISIPSFSAETESLNAAIATAIICSEFRRR